jgi:hypothetical protein
MQRPQNTNLYDDHSAYEKACGSTLQSNSNYAQDVPAGLYG